MRLGYKRLIQGSRLCHYVKLSSTLTCATLGQVLMQTAACIALCHLCLFTLWRQEPVHPGGRWKLYSQEQNKRLSWLLVRPQCAELKNPQVLGCLCRTHLVNLTQVNQVWSLVTTKYFLFLFCFFLMSHGSSVPAWDSGKSAFSVCPKEVGQMGICGTTVNHGTDFLLVADSGRYFL